MNIDWVKSVDSNNSKIIILENTYRTNATISATDIHDDKVYQKLDYRSNFSVDNEDVNDEINKITSSPPSDSMNSITLLDNEYFIIQYLSKHIQQYKIHIYNIPKYVKLLTWINDASCILSHRLKLPIITKTNNGELIKRTYDFCPNRGNCQINYGNKKGKCCAPHYVHNMVQYDIYMIITYINKYSQPTKVDQDEKMTNNNRFIFEQEIFKILKQINTLQFVINQMYLELSSFKHLVTNINDIEKYHHNCKPQVKNNPAKTKFCFSDSEVVNALNDNETEEIVQPRGNLNTYRVWKE